MSVAFRPGLCPFQRQVSPLVGENLREMADGGALSRDSRTRFSTLILRVPILF